MWLLMLGGDWEGKEWEEGIGGDDAEWLLGCSEGGRG